jgi:hypothetical protein
MKAEKYGTNAEQRRFDIDWLAPGEVGRDQWARCCNCGHAAWPIGGGTPVCGLIGYKTARRAWCREYRNR